MLRKRADRIRGVAGSLEGRTVFIADAVEGAGPGLLRVITEAGANVIAAGADGALLDVVIAAVKTPPHPIVTTALPPTELLQTQIDDLVINPCPEDSVTDAVGWITLIETVASAMQDRGHVGSIVLVTEAERQGHTGSVAAFLRSEMEDLAARLAPNAIRVNSVACGPIGSTRRGQPQTSRATPLGHKTIHPIDVGKMVWFLLNGEMSAAITGATIRVDRGASLQRPVW